MVLKITFPKSDRVVNLNYYKEVRNNSKPQIENSINNNIIDQNILIDTEHEPQSQIETVIKTEIERMDEIMTNTITNGNTAVQMSDDELKAKMLRESRTWKFPNILPIMRNGEIYKYNTSLSAGNLAELYVNGTIYYDETIQRGVRYTPKGLKKPLIYNSNVKEILKGILDGTMDAGEVKLNFAKEFKNPLVYDEKNNTLSGTGALSICDAAHRLESFVIWTKSYNKNPELTKNPYEFYMPVTIHYLTHMQAENLFVEANSKGKPISKTRIAYHDVFNPSRKVAEAIEKNSLLHGKIEEISNAIKKNSPAIMTYKNLLSGVSIFPIATPEDAEDVSKFLVEFWDELVHLFPQSMGNVDAETKQKQREQNFAIESMWITAYFYVALNLYNDPEWKNKLKRLAENDFLSRTAYYWQSIMIDGKIVNRSSTQNYVRDIMIDYIVKGKNIDELNKNPQ